MLSALALAGASGFSLANPEAKAAKPAPAAPADAKKKAEADRKETLSLCVQLTARALRANLVRLRAKPEAAIAKRYDFQGLKVAIENPAGSERHWTERMPDGTERLGRTLMLHDYGFLEDHTGADDEEVDCYVGPDPTARFAYVVHQRRADNPARYDEDKVMLGFASADAAKAAFLAHRSDGEQAFGEMSVIPMDVFKQRLKMRRGTGKIRASGVNAKLQALIDQVSATRRSLKSGRSVAGGQRAARYADTLEEKAKRQAAEIVAGDLNAVPWSPAVRRLAERAHLHDPRIGRGWLPTWRADGIILRWPLDQILFSPQFSLVRLQVLPPFGSDHQAVLATVCVAAAS